METNYTIIKICGNSQLQQVWEPTIGDMVHVTEQKMYDNVLYHQTVHVTQFFGDKILLGGGDTKFLPKFNIWIPSLQQLFDMLFDGEEGWPCRNHTDLSAFLEVLSGYAQKHEVDDFYELVLRFTLSEVLGEE